jgi:hypothetical protein
MHPEYTPAFAARFWSRVDKSGACWLWTLSRHDFGYGQVVVKRRPRGAHRVAWELMNGPIPEGMSVLHRCDNPPCCNPAHLFLGTDADNAFDKVRKGRAPIKLTPAQVLEIRAKHAAGGTNYCALAREYGVTDPMVRLIVLRKAWKHL